MGLLFLMTVMLWIGVWHYARRIRRELPDGDGSAALISETVSVTTDFLEAGQVAALLSDGNYLGTISVRIQQRKHNQAGYVITMYDSGNLRSSYEAYLQEHQRTEDFRVLENFLENYGGCYDEERNALVYTTRSSARISDAMEGEMELKSRIAMHPLAQMESLGQIHTKHVGRT